MASTPQIQIVPLDFDIIRAELKRFLQNQSEFQDYNFEGSALSLLIDILSYDAYYHGWYTNFAVNEVFLPTAQIRNSVVAAARQIGYIPRSVTSSVADVTITVNNISPNEGSIILRKYTPFRAESSGTVFTFYNLEDIVVYPNGNTQYTIQDVQLYEGVLNTQTYTIDSTSYSPMGSTLTVFNQNIDTKTIDVIVKPSIDSALTYSYVRAGSSVTVGPSSNVYFLFETNKGDYEIQFGDNRLGRNLELGQQVSIRSLVSRGAESLGAASFTYSGAPLGTVSQTTDVSVSLTNVNIPAYGGAGREEINSIKRNAPNIYQAQGRVVTTEDARAILLSEVPGIESLTVWGGEDNDPPTYGKMFICMKPVNAERFGYTQKQSIISKILRPKASPILRFEAVDPDYMYLVTSSTVRYSAALTAQSSSMLRDKIMLDIENYVRLQLGQFGSIFRFSQFSSVIDNADPSIQSNQTTLLLEKRVIIKNTQSTYVLKFANPLYYAASKTELGGTSDSAPIINISSKIGSQLFSHVNRAGTIETSCWIQNQGNDIHVFKTVERTTAGVLTSEIVPILKNVGTVDFETGTVTLTQFFPTNVTTSLINELRIRAVPASLDILPIRDQIILLPEENVSVTLIEDLLNRRNTVTGRIAR